MKRYLRKHISLILLVIVTAAFAGCGATTEKWTRTDFRKYSQGKGAGVFTLKCFATEVNLKMGIICEEFVDSKYSIDIFPAREIKIYMEKKYGAKIDISEFEKLRKSGKLKVGVVKNDQNDKNIVLNPDYMSIEGASIGLGRYSISGSTWILAGWSEYRGSVGVFNFRDKVEMGKSPQMQVFIVLAPLGPFISVTLKVPFGKQDANGYYKLKTVAVEEVDTNFKFKDCNTAGLAAQIKNLHLEFQKRDKQGKKQ